MIVASSDSKKTEFVRENDVVAIEYFGVRRLVNGEGRLFMLIDYNNGNYIVKPIGHLGFRPKMVSDESPLGSSGPIDRYQVNALAWAKHINSRDADTEYATRITGYHESLADHRRSLELEDDEHDEIISEES